MLISAYFNTRLRVYQKDGLQKKDITKLSNY